MAPIGRKYPKNRLKNWRLLEYIIKQRMFVVNRSAILMKNCAFFFFVFSVTQSKETEFSGFINVLENLRKYRKCVILLFVLVKF